MQNSSQFLSPIELPPSIHGVNFPSTSGGLLHNEQGILYSGSQWSGASSMQLSLYPSPNVSPSLHYTLLPTIGNSTLSPVVSEQNIMVARMVKAAIICCRSAAAMFICPIPGCESTFTRSFNLKGHMRTHTSSPVLYMCK
ncbi:Calcineurin responsive transcriptional factor [Mycena sanguinolenta]|uniref:Calcineurin responsive transcriptional factor n=1 Tax=Mycena sanguinolenta TaxID=230812 RepID=A0A8H7DJC8_9AGAR|nr:Calcineurin responsive transcriptional factor [Mycena sanguinolenta]